VSESGGAGVDDWSEWVGLTLVTGWIWGLASSSPSLRLVVVRSGGWRSPWWLVWWCRIPLLLGAGNRLVVSRQIW
jgi:hypothetical protein